MKLYSRDYCELTSDEVSMLEEVKEREVVHEFGENLAVRKNLFLEYPKAARHYISLFPNNYLDIVELNDEDRLNDINNEFIELLNRESTNERKILNFIRDNSAYHIVGSILKSNFNFGHHDAFVIPEFMLGTSYKVDYLLFGRRSGGYEFAYIEFESPTGKITLQNGKSGEVIRKGLSQVGDWNSWLEANYQSLLETFNKYKKPALALPEEFYRLDKTRIHYVVVAGRRDDFNEKTYRLKRELKDNRITLLHYDNLYDSARNVVGKSTY